MQTYKNDRFMKSSRKYLSFHVKKHPKSMLKYKKVMTITMVSYMSLTYLSYSKK